MEKLGDIEDDPVSVSHLQYFSHTTLRSSAIRTLHLISQRSAFTTLILLGRLNQSASSATTLDYPSTMCAIPAISSGRRRMLGSFLSGRCRCSRRLGTLFHRRMRCFVAWHASQSLIRTQLTISSHALASMRALTRYEHAEYDRRASNRDAKREHKNRYN